MKLFAKLGFQIHVDKSKRMGFITNSKLMSIELVSNGLTCKKEQNVINVAKKYLNEKYLLATDLAIF